KCVINFEQKKLIQFNNRTRYSLEQDKIDAQNIKRCVSMVKKGNVYKGVQSLKSRGIAKLDTITNKLLLSKFDSTECNEINKIKVNADKILVNEEVINLLINKLDNTSASGTDSFSVI